MNDWLEQIELNGFTLIPSVFPRAIVDKLRNELSIVIEQPPDLTNSIRKRNGAVYAARNVTKLVPAVRDVWNQQPLPELLAAVLGPVFGLVRVLYFDKPPEQTWALPWHKDRLIAIREPAGSSQRYSPVRDKAGVPHVEPPLEVLEAMLTLRIHLDDVTEENGPLRVLPGSHHTGKVLLTDGMPDTVLAREGDVLVMRPLLAHTSGKSSPGTTRHRRILHLEFSSVIDLPDGYAWFEFVHRNFTG